MKILFVAPYVPSLIRVRPYQFLRELARDHEVTVLATDSTRGLRDAEPLERALAEASGKPVAVHTVPLGRASMVRSSLQAAATGEPLQAAVCQSRALDRRLANLLARNPYDVVHIEHLRAARLVRRLPADVPRVYDAVDCISLLLERTLRRSHDVRQRLTAIVELRRTRHFEGEVLHLFDRVAVTSPDDAQTLRQLARDDGHRVRVVPNGVDLEAFRPLSGPREPTTLVISGKMSYHANITAVLHFARDVFPRVRSVRPDTRLRVVGSNPPPVLRALADDPAIEVTGYVPDLREAVGRATISVCPVTVKVGIQNKILEAMALGVPVVSTAAGAEGLEAQPGRDFLVARDPAELAAHIVRLLEDEACRTAMGHAGRAYVERCHRWADMAARLEQLYEEARGRRSAAGGVR